MNKEFELRTFNGGRFIGMSLMNSFLNNRNFELWSSFMPRRKEIEALASTELFAVQLYPTDFFEGPLQPERKFEIMALCPATELCSIPEGMFEFFIPESKYAVFNYKGTSAEFSSMAHFIYGEWLPNSPYKAAARPHFQVMGNNYLGPENPNSEEEVWVPIDG